MEQIKPTLDTLYIFYVPAVELWTKGRPNKEKHTLYVKKDGSVTLYYNSNEVDVAYSIEEVDEKLTFWRRALTEEMDRHGWTHGELIVKEVKMQRETLRDFTYTTMTRE
jgi:hypothetical protein